MKRLLLAVSVILLIAGIFYGANSIRGIGCILAACIFTSALIIVAQLGDKKEGNV